MTTSDEEEMGVLGYGEDEAVMVGLGHILLWFGIAFMLVAIAGGAIVTGLMGTLLIIMGLIALVETFIHYQKDTVEHYMNMIRSGTWKP